MLFNRTKSFGRYQVVAEFSLHPSSLEHGSLGDGQEVVREL